MKKIIIFGNKQIVIDCLEFLKGSREAEVIAVVGCETKDDLKAGNPSLKNYCQKNNLIYFNPQKLDEKFLKKIADLKPDLGLSLLYRSIFPRSLLAIPTLGFVNLHPSLLPKYRGPVPHLWALLNNEKYTGVTLHYIENRIDSGDIIKQLQFKIPKQITGFELGNILVTLGSKLLKTQLPLILKEKNKRIKQNSREATYFGQYNQALRSINWYCPKEKILRKIQAFAKPYSGATAKLNNNIITIWLAESVVGENTPLTGPGKIIKILDNDNLVVSTVNGYIKISDYTLEKNLKSFIVGERFDLF